MANISSILVLSNSFNRQLENYSNIIRIVLGLFKKIALYRFIFQCAILDITELDVSTNAVSFVKIHVDVIPFREFVKKDVSRAGMGSIVYSVSCIIYNTISN